MSLWKFDYEFDRERLLQEATEIEGYKPFTDVGNQSNEDFVEWFDKNPHLKEKVSKFYEKLRVHVKDVDKCPYALSLAKYFTDLTEMESYPRFYYQKKGYRLGLHTDRGTQCSLNFVLTEDPDPIYFENDEQVYYRVGLLNTSEKHAVHTTKDRYLFKLSFAETTFEEIKDVLSSKLSG